jgi:lysophospholipase L1-like esterase
MARRHIQLIGLLLWTGFSLHLTAAESPDPFEFKDGDRVLFLGDTLVERAQSYGHIEARLTGRFPDRDVTFRNLGWSADTPQGKSRASFDWNQPPVNWFKELTNQVATLEPNVVFIGYGMADSFKGEAHLETFRDQLTRLINGIQLATPDWEVRFVLLTPVRHESLGDPLPNPAPHNQQLELYTQAIKTIAHEGGHRLVSLFDELSYGEETPPEHPLTDNGIHLTGYGYWRAAEVIEKELGWLHSAWRVGITPEGNVREGSYGVEVSDLERDQDQIRFTARLKRHPPYFTDPEQRQIAMTPPCLIQVQGLSEGDYTLLIDGEQAAAGSAREWSRGRVIRRGAPFSRAEELRQTIIRKNELFFHRWRPQNQTYLFGFRKHEQGQNAIEIPQFDPLVAEQEVKIARLRQPVSHTFELIRSNEADQQDYP